MERIVDGVNLSHENDHEVALRPKTFNEYLGQEKVVANISLMVESAKIRNAAMDHVLLSGPPGLGKTSLAMLIAKALGSEMHLVSGPAIEKKGDLAAVLTNIKAHDVLFIDEIHRMHITVEEILYAAMEDFRLDILIGQGATARTMQIDLVPFTLVGATTRSGLLSNPLRDRFTAHLSFDYYSTDTLAKILSANASKLGIQLNQESKVEIARRARGTPRIANRILRRVRDFALVAGKTQVELNDVKKSLQLMDIDELGLDTMDRKILQVMKMYYSGGPVGIEALSATLGEDKQTIEEVYEPFLLKQGLILRTPRGRVLSSEALEHIERT